MFAVHCLNSLPPVSRFFFWLTFAAPHLLLLLGQWKYIDCIIKDGTHSVLFSWNELVSKNNLVHCVVEASHLRGDHGDHGAIDGTGTWKVQTWTSMGKELNLIGQMKVILLASACIRFCK